jgi:hypothetical protein
MKLKIFVSYSHRDADFVADGPRSLISYLQPLEARHGVEFWSDLQIATGTIWGEAIKAKIAESKIALVLVSQWFLDSAYIKRREIASFLRHRRREGMVIFPVIVGPCDWRRHSWLAKTQFIPQHGNLRSLKRPEREAVYLEIRRQLEDLIHRLLEPAPKSQNRRSRQLPRERPLPARRRPDAFGAVGEFVEVGDYISAISRITDGRSYESIPPDDQLDVVVIYQKLGLLLEARRCIDATLKSPGWFSLPADLQASFRVVELKILSQEGRLTNLVAAYGEVRELLQATGQDNRVPQILHRAGSAHAVLGQQIEAFKCFDESMVLAAKFANVHAQITIGLFKAIAQATGRLPVREIDEEPLSFIVSAQERYLEEPTAAVLWQANSFKSAVQGLFSEASVMLDDRHSPCGWIRLTAAHLLGPRAKSNPDSEGYAELLTALRSDASRSTVRSAMLTTDAARAHFQQTELQRTPYLAESQVVLNLVKTADVASWRRLRRFFDQIDRRYL